MEQVLLKQVKQGEYFRLKDNENAPLWVRNHYDRASKTYSCSKYDDSNHETFLKPIKKVFV
jgi:hypothetical protein